MQAPGGSTQEPTSGHGMARVTGDWEIGEGGKIDMMRLCECIYEPVRILTGSASYGATTSWGCS